MSLHSKILSDFTESYKAKQTERSGTLRMVKSALLTAVKEKGTDAQTISDEEVVAILAKEAKKRKEAAEQFRAGGREDLATKEDAEQAVIMEYLPQQASDEAIRAEVEGVVASLGGSNFGAIMGEAMKRLKGKADGNRVRAIVQEVTKQ